MSENLISIIVPVYNVELYLEECLKSLVTQTYKNIEILLLNDGSTDRSAELCDILAKNDDRIKVFHFENVGLASTRNRGIDRSQGKFITFVDSDDWIDQEFCEKMLGQLLREDADCVSSGFKEVWGDKKINRGPKADKNLSGQEFVELVLTPQAGVSLACGKLWKYEFIEANKLRFDENIKNIEDVLFHATASLKLSKVSLLALPLYNYRYNSESIVRSYNPKYADFVAESLIELKQILLSYTVKKVAVNYNNFVSYFLMKIAVNYCFHPQNEKVFSQKVKLLRKIANQEFFKESIKGSNYFGLSLSRKIPMFFMKRNLFGIVSLIADFRQRQLRR